MPSGEVHWYEGMFLRPHHFLTEHRRMIRLMQLDGKWDVHHNWGLRNFAEYRGAEQLPVLDQFAQGTAP